MSDAFQYGQRVQVSAQMMRDQALSIADYFHWEIREALRDMTEGPRYGPRRVLNDEAQAELDRRAALAAIVLDLAEEWGVEDLVVRDEDY